MHRLLHKEFQDILSNFRSYVRIPTHSFNSPRVSLGSFECAEDFLCERALKVIFPHLFSVVGVWNRRVRGWDYEHLPLPEIEEIKFLLRSLIEKQRPNQCINLYKILIKDEICEEVPSMALILYRALLQNQQLDEAHLLVTRMRRQSFFRDLTWDDIQYAHTWGFLPSMWKPMLQCDEQFLDSTTIEYVHAKLHCLPRQFFVHLVNTIKLRPGTPYQIFTSIHLPIYGLSKDLKWKAPKSFTEPPTIHPYVSRLYWSLLVKDPVGLAKLITSNVLLEDSGAKKKGTSAWFLGLLKERKKKRTYAWIAH